MADLRVCVRRRVGADGQENKNNPAAVFTRRLKGQEPYGWKGFLMWFVQMSS